MAVRRCARDAERLGRLGECQASVVPELDQAGRRGINPFKSLQGLIEREHIHVWLRRRNLQLANRLPPQIAAGTPALLAAGLVDQYPPHGLGSRGKEMAA